MAIYHFSAQVISRSQGRSSVAASAYRAAERLHDARLDETYDFTKKNDVVESAILLPENAPSWMGQRETLWNAVEKAERRKDAQLAREINIALPKELDESQNWALLTSFVQREFVDKGMVADVAFHRGHKGGEEQPHGHVMLTFREVTPEGFGPKVRAWNGKDLLQQWREKWAEVCNHHLAKHGFDMQIDHRTLEAQGINLEPQTKIGAKAAQQNMTRWVEHQALAERNGERLLADPTMALKAITHQQSTFSHQDIARFVNRHSVDEGQFNAVYQTVLAHPDLVSLGRDEAGRERYTTQEMLSLESKMMDQVLHKAGTTRPTTQARDIALKLAGPRLSEEQKAALNHITQGNELSCLVGFAGTGKSYMLGAAKKVWEAQGYQVRGIALSGIAAEGLESGSGIESHTVASRLWCWDNQHGQPLGKKDVVVVDEAGMLGSRQMANLMEYAHRAKAKVVLVGDPEQLQAIEAGAAFRAITERVGFAEMTEIRRQRATWQQHATRDLAQANTVKALAAYEAHDHLHVFERQSEAMMRMVERWDEVRSQSPKASQILLAYTRDEVKNLNEQARMKRHEQGELGEEVSITTSRGARAFAEHDRIYFLRNDAELKVKNGTLGTIQAMEGQVMTVALDPDDRGRSRTVEVNTQTYNHLDHGYAATVYKTQGTTVDRTFVLASQYFDRHTTYVALSRHRDSADVYYSREAFNSFNALNRTLSRERSKDVTLDYATTRGFDAHQSPQLDETQPLERRPTRSALRRAEDRVVKRRYQKALNILEKETGLNMKANFEIGEKGRFHGELRVNNARYGVLEQDGNQAILVPFDSVSSKPKQGEMMQVESSQYSESGLKVSRAKSKDLDPEMSLGLSL